MKAKTYIWLYNRNQKSDSWEEVPRKMAAQYLRLMRRTVRDPRARRVQHIALCDYYTCDTVCPPISCLLRHQAMTLRIGTYNVINVEPYL